MAEAVVAIGGYIAKLERRDARERLEVLDDLKKTDMATRPWHADPVVTRLDDSDRTVRSRAAQALRMLDPATIAPHVVESLGRIV